MPTIPNQRAAVAAAIAEGSPGSAGGFAEARGLAEWAADTAGVPLPARHPRPEGHKILLRPMASKRVKELSGGKRIHLPDMAQDANELMTCVSQVIAVAVPVPSATFTTGIQGGFIRFGGVSDILRSQKMI